MKKSIALLLVLALLCASLFTTAGTTAENTLSGQLVKSYAERLESLHDPDGRLLCAAHRCGWHNAPENSLQAIENAIALGVDMVEFDLQRTSDGVLILSHDDTVDRMTNGSGKISSMTYAQIQQLYLREGEGGSTAVTEEKIPTFEEALAACKGKVLINLDKAWDYRDQVWSVLVSMGTTENCVIKSSDSAENVVAWLDAKQAATGIRPEFSMMFDSENLSDFNQYITTFKNSASFPVMIELVSGAQDTILLGEDVLSQLQGSTRIFFNAMWSSISATRTDDPKGWHDFMSKGVNMIQTDNPESEVRYIDALYSEKAAGTKTEGEYFSNVSDVSAINIQSGSSVSVPAGGYVVYKDVVFDGSVGKVVLRAGTAAASAEASFYIDSLSESPVAVVPLSYTGSTAVFQNVAGALTGTVTGKHTLYIRFSGQTGLDYFKFIDSSLSIVSVAPVNLTTVKNTAPNLPLTVMADYGDDVRLSVPVVWNYVEKSAYASVGSFTVSGKISGTDKTVEAVIHVSDIQPAMITDGLLDWFDASSVSADDGAAVTTWTNKGSGGNATVSSSSTAPVLDQDVINGKAAALIFDGADDYLGLTEDLNGKSNLTVVLVNRPDNDLDTSAGMPKSISLHTPLYFHESGSWGQFFVGSFKNYVALRFGVGNDTLQVRGWTYTREKSVGSYTTTIGVKNGTSEKLYVDGSDLSSEATFLSAQGTTAEKIANISTSGWIGRSCDVQNNSYYYKGAIAEIMIFNRSLSEDEVASLQAYLDDKYSRLVSDMDIPELTVVKNTPPELPTAVTVHYTDGTSANLPVIWDGYDTGKLETAETFRIYGSVDGLGLRAATDITVEKFVVPGDVDGDGKVTVSDVISLRSVIMKGSATEDKFTAGNLNGDDILSVSDVIALRALIMAGTSVQP